MSYSPNYPITINVKEREVNDLDHLELIVTHVWLRVWESNPPVPFGCLR